MMPGSGAAFEAKEILLTAVFLLKTVARKAKLPHRFGTVPGRSCGVHAGKEFA